MAMRLVEMMVIIVLMLAIKGCNYGCEDGGAIRSIDGWYG